MAEASEVLAQLRGGLIVSVQAEPISVLDNPDAIALLARCAVANGAAGLRIAGRENIAAVRAALGAGGDAANGLPSSGAVAATIPIVGIVKRRHAGFAPYITSTFEEIDEVAAGGAQIVAFDATLRPRAGGCDVAMLVADIQRRGLLAMADCSDEADGAEAAAAGADIVATTLAGYTDPTRGRPLPALDVTAAIARLHPFAVCEGGIAQPGDAASAFTAGASAVVVGTALTNVDALVRRFVAATPQSGDRGNVPASATSPAR